MGGNCRSNCYDSIWYINVIADNYVDGDLKDEKKNEVEKDDFNKSDGNFDRTAFGANKRLINKGGDNRSLVPPSNETEANNFYEWEGQEFNFKWKGNFREVNVGFVVFWGQGKLIGSNSNLRQEIRVDCQNIPTNSQFIGLNEIENHFKNNIQR